MTTVPDRISFQLGGGHVEFNGLKSEARVAFFGNGLSVECQQCGAHNQTARGHRYCVHVSCPIALIEAKRRKRKRTSSLETIYIPRLAHPPADGPLCVPASLTGAMTPPELA